MDWNFGSLSLNSAYQIIEKSRFPGTFILTSDDKNRFITLLLTTDPAPEVVLIGIFLENNQFSLFVGSDREKRQVMNACLDSKVSNCKSDMLQSILFSLNFVI